MNNNDNVIALGSDQDDWYTLGALKRSIKYLEALDPAVEANKLALKQEKKVFRKFFQRFINGET